MVEGKVPATKQRTSFHRCFGILSASVIGSMNVSFITRVSGIQIAHRRCTQSPSTVCLNAPPSFGHRMHDFGMKVMRASSMEEGFPALPLAFQVRRCTFGIATGLQEYMALHNNLDGQQGCTHHKTRLHSYSRPPNHRKWRRWNPQMALPYPASASSWSICKVQVRTQGSVHGGCAPDRTSPSPNGP